MSGIFDDLLYSLSHPAAHPADLVTFAAGVAVLGTFFALLFRVRTDPDRK